MLSCSSTFFIFYFLRHKLTSDAHTTMSCPPPSVCVCVTEAEIFIGTEMVNYFGTRILESLLYASNYVAYYIDTGDGVISVPYYLGKDITSWLGQLQIIPNKQGHYAPLAEIMADLANDVADVASFSCKAGLLFIFYFVVLMVTDSVLRSLQPACNGSEPKLFLWRVFCTSTVFSSIAFASGFLVAIGVPEMSALFMSLLMGYLFVIDKDVQKNLLQLETDSDNDQSQVNPQECEQKIKQK